MAGMSGGPWGGGRGGNRGGQGPGPQRPEPPRRPGEGPQIPELDELVNRGRERLRVLMGGGGRGGRGGPGPRMVALLGILAAVVLWAMASFYTVKPEERSVELFLGRFSEIGQPGLNFAPWPLVTREIINVTSERTVEIGTGRAGRFDSGLMLTGDENIVDIDFQVVWNISDPAKFLFNLRDPEETIAAVAESAMREIIAQSELAPILNRDRGVIAARVEELVQATLDSYDSGINIVRVNLDRADPPREVIDAFRAVQAAEQERDRLVKEADAYANKVLAAARGEAAAVLEEAEAYRARVVNEAEGEASRFSAVLREYAKAPEVTRRRLYLETMESVLGSVDKVLIDGQGVGQVLPYLPLDRLKKEGSK